MKKIWIWVAAVAVSLALTAPVAAIPGKDNHASNGNGVVQEDGEHSRGNGDRPDNGSGNNAGGNGNGSNGPAVSPTDDGGDNAHPSGKDREVNDGPTDDTQGNTQSDPDDDGRGPDRSNGGRDFPGGTGGVDKQDQDRNNGCGNDDDFEDDNEGWCRGGKPKPSPSPTTTPTTQPTPTPTTTVSPTPGPTATPSPTPSNSVSPSPGPSESPTPTPVGTTTTTNPTHGPNGPTVVGERKPSQLPFTGTELIGFIFVAVGVILAGYGLFWFNGERRKWNG